ncbi:MAG: pyruvate ferredoxin oxidoreductase, partial [Clostridiales bacterium]|nr:pyruvate ferredoxin oxidoreductase [Clostridiales bacterium]
MAYNLKEVAKKPERFTGGHRMCAGCGAPPVVRQVLRALKVEDHAVVGVATGCLEVSTFLYPYTAWKDSYIHNAFENVAATIAGAESAYVAMKKKGKFK